MWIVSELRSRGKAVELAVLEQYPNRKFSRQNLDCYIVTTYTNTLPKKTLVGKPGMGSGELPRNVIVGF